MTRENIVELLKAGIVEVEFIKKDGTTRLMKATLNANYLPEVAQDNAKARTNSDSLNPDLIKCFDVEADDWRCFKLSSMTGDPMPIEAAKPRRLNCEVARDSTDPLEAEYGIGGN